MNTKLNLALAFSAAIWIGGCGDASSEDDHNHDHDNGTHTHADGTVHRNGDHDATEEEPTVPLPAATIGEMRVELAQGHGPLRPGQESHLVVKLPYNDKGETIVRAWIGGQDRTLSMVGKGDYTAANNQYDIHAAAPDPLPANTMWWIELEKPDGTKALGSAPPYTGG